jgi:hypothetical protein
MSFSVFPHEHGAPGDEELSTALGGSRASWSQGLALLATGFGGVDAEWRSYGRVSGWSLNVKDRQGTLAYFYPQRGGFIVVVTVGHEAVERASARGLPPALADAIAGARPYAKGYSVATDICSESDLELVVSLCRMKRRQAGYGAGAANQEELT